MKKKLWIAVVFVLCLWIGRSMEASAAQQTVDNLILMVNFAEDGTNEFQTKYPEYQEMYTGLPRGMNAYIHTISDGQVTVNSYLPQITDTGFAEITLPGSSDNYVDNEARFVEAVWEAANAQAAALQIPAKLDSWGGEHIIDNVTILAQAPGGTGTFVSHRSVYGDNKQLFGWTVRSYNVIATGLLKLGDTWELGYSLAGHEFLHTLGAPDLYRNDGTAGQPVGLWDQQGQVLTTAQYPLVYTRKQLGWLEIPTIREDGDYTLQPAENTSGTRAYILKTSMSDQEFFVVEYRKKSSERQDYDYYVPENGLIVYRVNTSLETNIEGKNYIYVFRPGTQDVEKAEEVNSSGYGNAVLEATVGGNYRKSLGSSDLSAPFTQDTIFYSNGNNSGIVIDNIRFNADGTLTFHADFPELSGETYWQPLGESIQNLKYSSITGSGDGTKLYLTGIQDDSKAVTYCYDETNGWVSLGGMDATLSYTDVLYHDGIVYMAYTDKTGVAVAACHNNQWQLLYHAGDIPGRVELQVVNGELWIDYDTGNRLKRYNITGTKAVSDVVVSGAAISQTKSFYYAGQWYAVYGDFFGSGDASKGKIACYESGSWREIHIISSLGTFRLADACVVGGKVYLAAVDAEKRIACLIYDGNTWTEQVLDGDSCDSIIRLAVKDGIPYIAWSQNSVLKVKYYKDGQWTVLANNVSSDAMDIDFFCSGDTLYAVSVTQTGITTVRTMKTVEGEPEPEIGAGNVVIRIPDGYDPNGKIWVDGVVCTSTAWNGDSAMRLVKVGDQSPAGNGAAQIVTMCRYDSKNIPVGMYVWRLTGEDDHYLATAVPELENLFSYHGFSVRYMGKTGFRCTFGIDTEVKRQLRSSGGLVGYHLKEMGAIAMSQNRWNSNPMIYGNYYVRRGRTYYTENGKTYNMVLRTSGGRDLFANVLTDLQESWYKIDFVFRPYAILSTDTGDVFVYGPEACRSMYTVCKQVLAGNKFAPGTAGYQFLQNIVTIGDAQ